MNIPQSIEVFNECNEKMRVVFKQEQSNKSLLRYPGGKTRAVETITAYFPAGIKELCSPFFGGGSIELFMAAKGVHVYGFDIFRPLVEFWQSVIKYPNELAELVQEFYPLSKESFYFLQNHQTKLNTKIERAAAYYVINRSSFSGTTLSGGMSPLHPRFTQTAIERVRNFRNDNFTVQQMDFKASIKANKNVFLYLDPPYIIESTLYGKNGNTHKGFDHEGLCEILKNRNNWILSYNDCKEVRSMYEGYEMIMPFWKYGMSNNKSSKEILIFSEDIKARNANTNAIRKSI